MLKNCASSRPCTLKKREEPRIAYCKRTASVMQEGDSSFSSPDDLAYAQHSVHHHQTIGNHCPSFTSSSSSLQVTSALLSPGALRDVASWLGSPLTSSALRDALF